jgi:predicted negative regulator of RcsB-dependent stress response
MPMSDKEQMQIVKSWWQEYGYYLLFSVIFVLVTNFGWRHWQQYQNVRQEQASTMYMYMVTLLEQHKKDEVKLYGEKLVKDYAKSPYASLAALILAKEAINANDLKLADERLQFIIKKSSSKKLRQLARVRDARVLIAMKKSQEAITLLSAVDDDTYLAEVNEILGDAWSSLGKSSEAEQSYNKAKSINAKRKAGSPLLKMKMQL